NLDRACSEEFADAAGDGGVERAAEQSAGGGIAARLHLLLLIELRLFLGAAEREQVEDVGFAEWRLRAVSGVEAGGGAMQSDGDVVVFDAGAGIEIDDRVNTHRVAEVDGPALELILGAGEGRAAVCNADGPEHAGNGDRSTHGEVDGACEFGVAVLEVEL